MAARAPRLAEKVAIVTGAGSRGPGIGNGKATAVLFAREGASVVLVDSTLERAEATAATIRDEGGTCSTFAADVTKEDDARQLVDATIERYGKVNILHNNVGIGMGGSVLDVTEEEWDHVMAVNLKGMVFCSKYAIPYMQEIGGGSIINISSVAGMRAHGNVGYAASKGGVIALTRTMAVQACQGADPGQLYCPRAGLHTNGRWEHRRPTAGKSAAQRAAGNGRNRVGYRLGGGVLGQRRGALGDGRAVTG